MTELQQRPEGLSRGACRGHLTRVQLLYAFLASAVFHALILVWPDSHALIGGTQEIFGGRIEKRLAVTFANRRIRSSLAHEQPMSAVADDLPQIVPVAKEITAHPERPFTPQIAGEDGNEFIGIAAPYFPSFALTRLPEAMDEFAPKFPEVSVPWSGGGLELHVWIDSQGRVARVEPLSTEFPNGLIDASVRAFQSMRFRPGEILGKPVPSVSSVVVEFETSP